MKRKNAAALLCALLLCCLALTAQAGASQVGVVVNDVPTNRLHLRTLPSTDADSLGKYYTGVEVEVLDASNFGDWAKVRVRGVEGFMLKTFLHIGTDLNVAPAMPEGIVNNPNPADRLNLRQRPTERSESLGKYYNGTKVTVLGIRDNWYHVDVGGQSGFMRAEYLYVEGIDDGSGSTGGSTGGSVTGYATVNNPDPADRLHLRTQPSTDAPSLGKYYNGVAVRVLSQRGDWTHVEAEGVEGWMLSRYLSFPTSAVGSDVPSAIPIAYVNNPRPTDRLNLRQAADEDAASLGKYYNNTRLEVLGVCDGWYHVRVLEDGRTGYMAAAYVTLADLPYMAYGAYAVPGDLPVGYYLVTGQSASVALTYADGHTLSLNGATVADSYVIYLTTGMHVRVNDGTALEHILARPYVSDKTAMAFAGMALLRIGTDYPTGAAIVRPAPGCVAGAYTLYDAASGQELESGKVEGEIAFDLREGTNLRLYDCVISTNG